LTGIPYRRPCGRLRHRAAVSGAGRAAYPDFRGGTFTISSADLVPQRATNVETGLSGGSAATWSVLAYWMSVDDEIDFDVRTFSYANIGESRHVVMELEVAAPVQWPVRPGASYALSRVTQPGGDTQLKNVPRHALTLSADLDLPAGLAANLQFRQGRWVEGITSTIPVDEPPRERPNGCRSVRRLSRPPATC